MKASVVIATAFALVVASTEARADDEASRARVYYDAGTQAYAAGRYASAVEAFTEAYRLLEKPPILFSLAQAERRQYTVSLDASLLRSAIAHYRRYIAEVAQDGRRADAVTAVAELEALSPRSDRDPKEAAANGPKAPSTRVMISSGVTGATVVLDGAELGDAPVIEPVKPGKHTVRVSARGYVDQERELVALEGALVPLEVSLVEKPAILALSAPSGAEVVVDGRPLGDAPLGDVELKAGVHLVMVSQLGHTPYLGHVTIERGEIGRLHVDLQRTKQRVASYLFGASSLAAGVIGGSLGLAALGKEGTLHDLKSAASLHNLSAADARSYNDALASRDLLRRDAFITFGVAAALVATGTALYLLDHPSPTSESPRSSRSRGLSFNLAEAGLVGNF